MRLEARESRLREAARRHRAEISLLELELLHHPAGEVALACSGSGPCLGLRLGLWLWLGLRSEGGTHRQRRKSRAGR